MTKYDVACLFHIESVQSTFPFPTLQSNSKKVGMLKRRLKMLINAKYILFLPFVHHSCAFSCQHISMYLSIKKFIKP
jgi:hypothetical protein